MRYFVLLVFLILTFSQCGNTTPKKEQEEEREQEQGQSATSTITIRRTIIQQLHPQ